MELHSILKPDGTEYIINPANSQARILLSVTPGNWGLPPINYVDQRSYRQHGSSQVDYFLQPRTFSLSVQGQGCDRAELFELRTNLLNAVRPNQGGLLTYIFRRADGTDFRIDGRAISPTFPSTPIGEWDEFAYIDDIEIQCIDPTWYQPGQTCTADTSNVGDLVFPITFPIVFGDVDEFGRCDLNDDYVGNWFSYPTIIATGPFTRFSVTHAGTGRSITYLGSAIAGQTVTIKLANSYSFISGQLNVVGPTVIDSIAGDQFGLLSFTSDLDGFRIEPVGTDDNTIIFSAPGSGVGTTFILNYDQRYIGI